MIYKMQASEITRVTYGKIVLLALCLAVYTSFSVSQKSGISNFTSIFNVLPTANADVLFDYSGEVPDGVVQYWTSFTIKPTPTHIKKLPMGSEPQFANSIAEPTSPSPIVEPKTKKTKTAQARTEKKSKSPKTAPISSVAKSQPSTIKVESAPKSITRLSSSDHVPKYDEPQLRSAKAKADSSSPETMPEEPVKTVNSSSESVPDTSKSKTKADSKIAKSDSDYVPIPDSSPLPDSFSVADLVPKPEPVITVERTENAWDVIRSGFAFAELDNKTVRQYEKFYSKNPKTLAKIVERAELYLPYVVAEVEKKHLPMELALLPVIESAFNPRAYSKAGAAGLWQFMPSTGKQYGLERNWWYEGRRDIIASTDAALRHLQDLSDVFDDDWHLALAAYNAGMYGVQRAIKSNEKRNKPTDYSSLKLHRETRHFVPKLVAVKNIVLNPKAFGVTLPFIPMNPKFEIVEFDFQVDLGIVAASTRIQEYKLSQLNPGLRRIITPPEGPHRVLVPSADYQRVMSWKASLLPSDAVTSILYHVKSGDSLGVIADRYNVSVAAIKSVNSKNSDLIRIGELLRIPTPTSLARNNLSINGNGDIVYHVVSGDSLSLIAQRYDVSVLDLKSANLLSSDMIRVGQKLHIPVPGSADTRGKTTATAEQPKPNRNQQYVVYNVVSGDTLYHIAQRYRVSVAQLRVANSLSSDRIQVDQKLKVPVSGTTASRAQPFFSGTATRYSYTVKSGDTLWGIAREHETTVSDVMEWNGIDRDSTLQKGQKLIIFVD